MKDRVIVWRITQDCNMRCRFCSYSCEVARQRDDADTARREFDFIKHIHIKVNEDYKSIEKIDIDFSINHGSKDNTFTLTIKNSGDNEAKGKKTKTNSLTENIKELLKPYSDNKKYGICQFVDDREVKK